MRWHWETDRMIRMTMSFERIRFKLYPPINLEQSFLRRSASSSVHQVSWGRISRMWFTGGLLINDTLCIRMMEYPCLISVIITSNIKIIYLRKNISAAREHSCYKTFVVHVADVCCLSYHVTSLGRQVFRCVDFNPCHQLLTHACGFHVQTCKNACEKSP